jgi:hypothetical protein
VLFKCLKWHDSVGFRYQNMSVLLVSIFKFASVRLHFSVRHWWNRPRWIVCYRRTSFWCVEYDKAIIPSAERIRVLE